MNFISNLMNFQISMPLERLAFDNGNFKSAMENFKNSKTKEREAFDRTITEKNNELNDLQVCSENKFVDFFCLGRFSPPVILVHMGQTE